MPRIDLPSLTSHLELVLSCAPSSTIAALRDSDALKRRLAAVDLAEFLAERLGANMTTVEYSQEMDAIEAITRKLAKETSQYPQRALVADQKELAEKARTGISGTDDELAQALATFFLSRRE